MYVCVYIVLMPVSAYPSHPSHPSHPSQPICNGICLSAFVHLGSFNPAACKLDEVAGSLID